MNPDINEEWLRHGQIKQIVGMREVATNEQEESTVEAKQTENAKNVVIQTATAEGMLLNLIKTMVDPESWDDTNGDGAIMVMSGIGDCEPNRGDS